MTADYTGHVDPDGPTTARVVEADGVEIEVRKLSVGPMDNNCYVLIERASRRALLIDAANDAGRILAEVEGLRVETILTTHGHDDHWQALAAVADSTGATVVHHPADAEMIPRAADQDAADEAALSVGEVALRLVHTPGHTPGSICALLGERHLFSGDTLFPGGPGNTFGDGVAFRTIMGSLRERLFPLPDDTWVYPGHGDDTTIGAERPSLDDWEQRGW